jgi:RHS repeat-associated protein
MLLPLSTFRPSELPRGHYGAGSGVLDTGLRQTVIDKDAKTTTYTYDQLDRLTRARTTNSSGVQTADFQYGYDRANNRTSETVNGTTTTAAFNQANQLTSRAGVGYAYDGAGNWTATTNSGGAAFSYSAANRSASLKPDGGSAMTAAYAGPSQVQRTRAGAVELADSRLGVTYRRDPGVYTDRYTRDATGGLVGLRSASGSCYYYLFDGLGSVVAVTDASGTVRNRYSYSPYGETSETCPTGNCRYNPWRYTGAYQDPTGLYKMGHRYYEPELGRWTQRDPITQQLNVNRTGEYNPYVYVACNPINSTDALGLVRDGLGCALGGAGLVASTVGLATLTIGTGGAGAAVAGGFAASQGFALSVASVGYSCSP